MFFKNKPLKNCQISQHYFWLIKTKKHGIINVSGKKGKLKKIVGNKATVIFDDYGKQVVPANLIRVN